MRLLISNLFFFSKKEKYERQFCENGLANSYKAWKPNSKVSEGYDDPNRLKNVSKMGKKRSQNFAFLDTLGYFVTLRPNGFSWLHQIWHTSSQDSSAFSCKILKTSMTYKCHFLARKSQKMLKITKICCFFLGLYAIHRPSGWQNLAWID